MNKVKKLMDASFSRVMAGAFVCVSYFDVFIPFDQSIDRRGIHSTSYIFADMIRSWPQLLIGGDRVKSKVMGNDSETIQQ